MGYSVIKGPRELHSVRTPEQYRAKHAQFIGARAATGQRVSVHESSEPLVSWVDRLSGWIVKCECGAGNSTDPEWGIACCYDCGCVHNVITFPKEWRDIEAALLLRPQQLSRGWEPYETLDDLRAENATNGVQ